MRDQDHESHPRYQEMLALRRKIITDSYSPDGVRPEDRELLSTIYDEIYPDRHITGRFR